MTILGAVLTIFGVFIVLLLTCLFADAYEKRCPSESYDERQQVTRGKAYRFAFWLGLIYNLLVVTLGAFDGTAHELYFLVMVGLMLQVMAFHICCLIGHAVLPLSQKPVFTIVTDFMVGVCDLGLLWGSGATLGTKISEIGNLDWLQLICGICFILLGIMHLIQLYWDKREEEELSV